MIMNERQHRITKNALERFEEALARLETTDADQPPEIRKVMRDAIESQLEALREEITEYEELRSGKVQVLELDSLQELPGALIRARIVAGLTQKTLAGRLALKEQQIQRYEATHYAGVSLDRIQAVAQALGITIRERLTLPSARG